MSVSIDQFYSNEPIPVLKPAPRGNNLGMMQAIENTGIQVPENDPFKTLHEAVPGLRVTSQLRDEEHNRRVGGVKNSRHLFGDAIDIGTPNREQQAGIRQWASANGFRIKNDYADGHWHLEPLPGNRRSGGGGSTGGKPDFSNVQGTPGATPVNKEMSVDEFYAGLTPADFSTPPDLAAKRKDDKSFLENAGDAISRAARSGFDFIMERLNQEGITQAANAEEAAMGVGQVQRTAIPRPNGTMAVGNVAVEGYDDARLRWIEKVRGNPDELRNVPKYMREDVMPYAISSMPEVRGFIANLENPVQLLLESSMPANLASYYANLPEIARKNLDEARKVQMQENIVANPNKFPAVSVQAAREAIARREAQQDPGVREMWDQLKKAAKEDPGGLGAQFVNAIMADPYMLAAPVGIGVKPIQGTRAMATGAAEVGRAARITDQVIDAGVTAAGMNAAITAAEGLANAGEADKKAIAISAGLGAAIGGPLGPIFMRGSRARATISNKSAAGEVLDNALKDLAAEDVAAERFFSETSPESFARQPTEIQQRINALVGIRSADDIAKFRKQYEKDIKALFKTEAEYANYLEFKAQERLDRAAELAAERVAQNYRSAAAARIAVVEDDAFSALRAERVARWRDEFDAAISQRDQAAADDILRQTEEAWGIHEADQKWIAKLDADDAMEAAWGADVPQVKRALNKASARDAAMNRPKWQRGEIDPRLAAAVGITSVGAAAGAAMFPKDQKKGMLAGAIISGLSVAGLGRWGGGRSPGSLRRLSQEGAIKPKGGNWRPEAPYQLNPDTGGYYGDDTVRNSVQRYLNRYAGTSADPLNDLVLPDGTRWEDAMDKAIRLAGKDRYGGQHYGLEMAGPDHEGARAMQKIRSYMDHVGDYLQTRPYEEVQKMDFVRMVKETKRWDEANARKMEKAQVKFFKDAEVLREYDDGFKWIRLNKPGQFANESDLMGHSVRGYEPTKDFNAVEVSDSAWEDLRGIFAKYFDEDLNPLDIPARDFKDVIAELSEEVPAAAKPLSDWMARVDHRADWIPESIGGYADYGYGGWDAIKNDSARVYSLRDSKGKPVATIELGKAHDLSDGGWEISQIKGPRNEPVKKQYFPKIASFIKEWENTQGDLVGILENPVGFPMDVDEVYALASQAGRADTKTMARLAAVGLGGSAAFALAPEGEKEIAGLAGALAGLLLPAGGSVLSRMRQSGAVSLDGSFMALPMRRVRKGMSEAEEVAARAGELEMINGAKAGDQAAMKNLYDEYFPYVKRAVDRFLRDAGPRLAVDAEDVAQETMIKVFRNLETFQGNSEFSTWVHAIAKNEALNTITKSKSRPLTEGMESTLRFKDNDMAELGELPTKVEEVNPSTYDTPENFAILNEVQNQLSHAFDKMPEDIRLAMILKELEGFSEAEIAGQLDIPLGTVKSRLSRGRAMVEETLQRGWGAKVRGPKNQQGSIDPKILKTGAGVAAGAGLGLYMSRGGYDPDTGEWEGGNQAIAALGGAAFGAAVMAARGRARGNIIKKAWGSVSTDLLNKAPKIFGRLQHLERVTLEQTHRYIDKGHPFFAALRKVKQPDQDVVARALMTGNADVISKVFKAVGDVDLIKHYRAVREALDTLGKDLEGLNMIKRTGIEYFPRMVVDKEGLFAAIGKVDENNVKQALQKANEESLRKNGRTLNAMEESSIINKVLFTDKQSSQPGFAKNRGIQEITPELQKFYASPQESFNTYVRSAISEIEKAKFFGKYARKDKEGKLEYINIEKSVSKMMADEINAGMDVDTSREIADILKLRFGPGEQAEPGWIRDVKNLGNIGLLGNFWSAMTQLGDVGASLYINGFYNTAEAIARKFSGTQKVSMREFGLADHIAEEFANQRKTATWVNKTFRYSLFSGVDRLGKDVALNGAILKAGRQLKTDAGVQRFKTRYGRVFGEDTDKLIKALQKGDVQSDLTRDFAFMELARFQPISRIEYPEWYLKYPGARSYLWLQSFTMKQVDLLRRDVWTNFREGNYGQGFKNLAQAAIIMGMANTGVDAIKDWLLGKEVEINWGEVALNMFKNYGWSQYEMRQLTGVSKEEARRRREDGDTTARQVKAEPVKAIAGRAIPPYDMFETILRGDPRAWRYLVPGMGPYIAQKVKEADEFEKESRKEGW